MLSSPGSAQNSEWIIHIFCCTILIIQHVFVDNWVMYRLGILQTMIRRTLSYISRNVLTNLGLKLPIGLSYIFSLALTFKYVDNRTIFKVGQTMFDKHKENRIDPQNNMQPDCQKPDVTQADTLLASVWLFLPSQSNFKYMGHNVGTKITGTLKHFIFMFNYTFDDIPRIPIVTENVIDIFHFSIIFAKRTYHQCTVDQDKDQVYLMGLYIY